MSARRHGLKPSQVLPRVSCSVVPSAVDTSSTRRNPHQTPGALCHPLRPLLPQELCQLTQPRHGDVVDGSSVLDRDEVKDLPHREEQGNNSHGSQLGFPSQCQELLHVGVQCTLLLGLQSKRLTLTEDAAADHQQRVGCGEP